MEDERPSYYANIPAEVRYDKDLSPNAKLLYGEITALCNAKGYCWAGNKYFADLYDVSIKSISRWISQLVEKGYLTTELKYKANSKEVDSRRLSLNTIYNGYGQKGHDLRTKLSIPTDKKVKDNTTSNITSNKRYIVGKPDKAAEQKEKIPYDEIIDYLNIKAGKAFRTVEGNKKWIKARWNEGYRLDDFKKVIDGKTSEWKNDTKMSTYLRPSTLFGNKFDVYLNEQKSIPSTNGVRDERSQDFIDL